MIVKVKEPQAGERAMLREGQILYTYLHLAPDPEQTKDLVKSGAVCIAYETVTSARGGLPLLAPMSQVAGRMSVQSGAHCSKKPRAGAACCWAAFPASRRPKSLSSAAALSAPMRQRLPLAWALMSPSSSAARTAWKNWLPALASALKTLYSTQGAIEDECATADLVIGGVLIPGAAAPKLVTKKMLKDWKPGSVFVDVAIDQGGCAETSKATTHADPTYVVDGVIHYCVANMPGGVARTSTFALNNVTLPFAMAIANKGWKKALADDVHLKHGLNVAHGKVTYKAVADDLGYAYVAADKVIAG